MADAHSAEEIERQVKIGQALDLKLAGANIREIARTLKIGVATAHKYVADGLLEIREDNDGKIDELRKIEKARLEAVLVKLWSKRDNPRVADTIIRLSARLSALQGLDLGKVSGDDAPPPPPSSQLPAQINITLVAPSGTKVEVTETKPPIPETGEANGGTKASG